MAKPLPITDYKDLTKIRIKPQNRDHACSELRTIHALDTETYCGDVFLIADSDGRYLDKITAKSVFKFLFSKKYESAWNFFYNLSYDAEVILKLIGKNLDTYKSTRRLKFSFCDYTIEYVPSKCLKIRKGHHSVLFYDISQFFHASLLDAYEKNIGLADPTYKDLKQKRSEFSPTFYRRNTTLVRDYCIADCTKTKLLAEHWISLFRKAFAFYPLKWYSSGYLAERVLINNGIEFPKFDSIPYEIQEFAYRSYFGGRFEMLKRGFIGTAFLYDINSAYPFAISKIPDLSKGLWIKSKTVLKDAKLGFFKVRASIPDCKHVPPFPFRVKNNIIFPSGVFETYVTLAELQACESPKFYKILDSWQFVSDFESYPYAEFIQKMHQKRLELKQNDDPLQLPIKIILNSIYGKTGQKINRVMGNMFNPVIFSFITGFTRAQLYRFVIENNLEKDAVAFATDSICLTKKLDVDSKSLGEFSFDNSASDVYYLQNGFYRFNGKWKQRGLGKLGSKEIEHLETFEKNGRLYYSFTINRNTRLVTSIIQNRLGEIGKIKSYVKQMNLNADKKRLWLKKIESIEKRETNESIPLDFNLFKKEEI
jgi:hypothetical protein